MAKVGNVELLSFSGTIDALEAEICGLPIATRLWTRNNTGWVDVAAGWEAYSGYAADASCNSDAVKTFLWTLSPGRYMLQLTDGIVYLQAVRAAGNAVRYRWLRIYPNEGNGLLTALYDVDNEVWARGIDTRSDEKARSPGMGAGHQNGAGKKRQTPEDLAHTASFRDGAFIRGRRQTRREPSQTSRFSSR